MMKINDSLLPFFREVTNVTVDHPAGTNNTETTETSKILNAPAVIKFIITTITTSKAQSCTTTTVSLN